MEQELTLEAVATSERGQINAAQYEAFMRPLRGSRVASRTQGGKELSYLESWDVRAHLIRMFGFGNFDLETIDQYHVATREYLGGRSSDKEMVECIWFAKVRLVVRDDAGREIARYAESAVGSTSGPANMLGEHHDNAIKTAASDALKRCAINLGTQFGLSLYDDGSRNDVVKMVLVKPEGVEEVEPSTEQAKRLADSVGSVPQGKSDDDVAHEQRVSEEEAAAAPAKSEDGS